MKPLVKGVPLTDTPSASLTPVLSAFTEGEGAKAGLTAVLSNSAVRFVPAPIPLMMIYWHADVLFSQAVCHSSDSKSRFTY